MNLEIREERELDEAMRSLLSQEPAPKGEEMPTMAAAWQYRIGGGEDEA